MSRKNNEEGVMSLTVEAEAPAEKSAAKASRRKTPKLDLGFEEELAGGPSLRHLFAAGAVRDAEMKRAQMVSIENLEDNPFQPRLEMDGRMARPWRGIAERGGLSTIIGRRRHGCITLFGRSGCLASK